MKPTNLKTKIFLDSGDPAETREVLSILGFLDGQTTNPSLIAKNPETAGKKFSKDELISFYRKIVGEVSKMLPKKSVSVEVYADKYTTADEMFEQAKEFNKWIPNAHIKYPTNKAGLKAAEKSITEKMRVNMTLVFNQEQSAAVYAATKGAKKGDVFVSPFVGRLDDRGEDGMGLIKNILQMYNSSPYEGDDGRGLSDGHVEVLTASVRSLKHFVKAIELGSDIITAPLKILKEWKEAGMPLNRESGIMNQELSLKPIKYQDINLNQPRQEYNINHELTDNGIERFARDWNNLIK